ncbi:MAG: copper transporter [Rubrobacteraceae bacterium]|nr:copper transporter [Rubrobacter sp.]
MPDLRYHLISLISVFLALAIGILLGVAVADEGVVSERLEAEITGIQDRLDGQRVEIEARDREIASLQERAAADESVEGAMSETMISDRIIGYEVALVAGSFADPETVEGVESALATAGAEVVFAETLEAPSSASEVTSGIEATTPIEGDYTDVALSAVEASDDSIPPQAVVFVGGGELPPEAPSGALDALNEAQAEMLEVWENAGLRIVAAESSDAGRSEVELFQSAGVASVDNADTGAGRAAIIQLLASDEDGSYGIKDTASELFPPAPE